jgi:Ser/Thr protein kinase RdoA (MazF antagonist)
MKRETIVKICNQHMLDHAAALFGTTKDNLLQFGSYEGCVNLVYEYKRDGVPMILRISYQKPVDQIRAELHFVTYLADNGVRVSRPVPSQRGNLIESMQAEGVDFIIVSFVKGKGMRVPDNGYRYRDDAPIEEYFYNWGQVLGQMHALAKTYRPISETVRRPERFELARYRQIDNLVPARFPIVRERFHDLIAQIRALPKDPESYGLIHGDFNDGNFVVDYSNGDITVFDFDDAGYFWFTYELACAWESGIGRTMFNPSAQERRAFMNAYFAKVLEGYQQWNIVSDDWLARIPLFLKWVEMEEVLHFISRVDELDRELRTRLAYKIACVEQNLPYLGFFDSIYSSANPFLLV